MEITLWKQIIISLFGILAFLFMFGLFLNIKEKKGNVPAGIFGCGVLVVFALSVFFFNGSKVINISEDGEETQKWIMKFKDGEKKFSLDFGRTYLYNSGKDTCDLILYPVYYTAKVDLVGTPVNDSFDAIDIELSPGQIFLLEKSPHYLFRAPDTNEVSTRSDEIYWCLDRKKNVDTGPPLYKKLRIEYETHVEYY